MTFENVYDDQFRAVSYAKLEFPGTYYLAYRDLPAIVARHASGKRALDFGCGTGRSTRFLKKLGFDPIGIDISEDMLMLARNSDPAGDYRLTDDSKVSPVSGQLFNLILSVFTFDNIPTGEKKIALFADLGKLLDHGGVIVSLVSSPDIYLNEWASFTTKDFSENKLAKSGDKVRIIMTDVEDARPVEDILWSDASYRDVYKEAELEIIETLKPLASESEPFNWVNETTIAPWVIYVLKRSAK